MLNNIVLRNAFSNTWWQFIHPVKILTAHTLEEVLPVLKEVEGWTKSMGYYAAGFLSYEASPAFDKALTVKNNIPQHKASIENTSPTFPLVVFGIYTSPIAINFDQQLATGSYLKWQRSVSKEGYLKDIERIQDYIQKGDTYQVNYTLRQSAEFKDEPFELFKNIANQAPYGAFIDLENHAICSASPELFFNKKGNTITTRPMKGTMPRGRTNQEDQQNAQQLHLSGKDRAENVMIVDMIRNDLGRVADIGTVQIPQLYEVEKYPTVLQMTSTVTAQTNATFSQLMQALFPCASITGAPKANTMRIISKLENTPRRIYTGSIGFITPQGDMQFNVAIRTALINKPLQQIEYGTGSGITTQSIAIKEYEECLLKTQIIEQTEQNQPFSLLETMRYIPNKGVYILNRHLDRIANSAHYFSYIFQRSLVEKAIQELSFTEMQKLRLLVQRDGSFQIENYPLLPSSTTAWQLAIANTSIDSSNPFLFHKTTQRSVYQQHLAAFPAANDVLLWNEKEELTESCYGNVVLEKNGRFFTPPVQCGLLAGTFRATLLEEGKVEEKVLTLKDLEIADHVFIVNSVRRWMKCVLISDTVSVI